MLRDDIEQYTNLTGENGWNVPIMKVDAYLDGYNKGLAVLDKIRAELADMEKEFESRHDYPRADTLKYALSIIDKHMAERGEE